MNIIPAIDLKNGECVRLLKGEFNQITRYDTDPLAIAKTYQNEGVTQLHLVDLDGARKQSMTQITLIQTIAQSTNLSIQAGGGIRTQEHIKKLLHNGIERVVIGSLAVKKPNTVNQWIKQFGNDRIVIALDVRFIKDTYYCATQGWKRNSDITLWDCLSNYPNLRYLLCTDINLDGTLCGPNIDLYQQIIKRFPTVQLQASGGIGKLTDLQQLSRSNIHSVIIGKALYEKCFTLKEAKRVSSC